MALSYIHIICALIYGHKFVFQIYLQLYLKGFFCRIYTRIRKLNFGFGSETHFMSLLEVAFVLVLANNIMQFIYKY